MELNDCVVFGVYEPERLYDYENGRDLPAVPEYGYEIHMPWAGKKLHIPGTVNAPTPDDAFHLRKEW